MPRKRKEEKFYGKTPAEWADFAERMSNKWGRKDWSHHANRGRAGFGAFLLSIGIYWLLSRLGLVTNITFWPIVVILFGLFLTLASI
jgi:hypothetical protein